MRQFVGFVGLLLVVAACNTPPPQPWLRFEPAGPHPWTRGPEGQWMARFHGADVAIDLNLTQTRVQVTVVNNSGAAVEMRMGPEAASPSGAIGDVLLRPLDAPPGISGADPLPYNSMQAMLVEHGWRAVFHLDAPLGREPVLGQYFVLTVEARDQAGRLERRSLPLVATNAGTMPRGSR
jgi:hypothetical protein